MSLPEIGETVTIVLDWNARASGEGTVVDRRVKPPEFVVWKDAFGEVVTLWARDEGIAWMRGAGPDVNRALLAAFALFRAT